MMDVKEDWLSMVYKFFVKKTAGDGMKSLSQNEQLAEKLHKAIIRKFKKKKKSIFNIQRQYMGF